MTSTARRLAPTLLTALVCLVGSAVRAQLPDSEERLKILTDPESIKKKFEKEKTRPPLEVFRSQITPFDVLPFVKANHWSTINLEVRSNYVDYVGSLQTMPVPMLGLPQEIIYRREVRLAKAQQSRLGMQLLLPKVPKELTLELIPPDAIRADEVWPASLRVLEPHQMLIVVLMKETSDAYAPWNKFQALYPNDMDRGDALAVDKLRYYRLVLPMNAEKPPLSPHPLTWTTISHVIWDGQTPDALNSGQQQAMLDWLHWGGQLVIVGGPGPSFSLLKDSFLSPYLPAEPSGENALLSREDLLPMARDYPPPASTVVPGLEEEAQSPYLPPAARTPGRRYRSAASINPPKARPVFLAGLKPNLGAIGIPLGESSSRLIGVERRVGRGRVLMLGFSPTDPSLTAWSGLDTFVRRVILRRPEESRVPLGALARKNVNDARFGPLPGPDLSWVRYFSRDMGLPVVRTKPELAAKSAVPSSSGTSPEPDLDEDTHYEPPDAAVAEWLDASALPRLCRDVLEEASGIKVPGASFVLKVVLAYLLALVPLNWLICRYVFGRRELAWVVAPVLSLAFAVGVERAAAYDIGYNSACDEIDVVETFGEYPRAHVSRFASLFTTGRTRFTISYPDNPTALALPLDTGRSLRGEDVSTSSWQSFPVPALEGFLVQPRSLAMFRAEEMLTLDGSITLTTAEGKRSIVNGSSLPLQDAVLVDVSAPRNRRETYLGTISPGATVEVSDRPKPPPSGTPADALRPQKFLREFRNVQEDRPENKGELRLVAWTPHPMTGQNIEPAVDRRRGFTAFVVHLRHGPPPPPDGPHYDGRLRRDGAEAGN